MCRQKQRLAFNQCAKSSIVIGRCKADLEPVPVMKCKQHVKKLTWQGPGPQLGAGEQRRSGPPGKLGGTLNSLFHAVHYCGLSLAISRCFTCTAPTLLMSAKGARGSLPSFVTIITLERVLFHLHSANKAPARTNMTNERGTEGPGSFVTIFTL